MKLLKPLLTVLALAFALIFVTACSSGGNGGASSGKTTAKARTIDEIKKSGELRIAVFGDKKPFGYVDNDGSYQGTISNWEPTGPRPWCQGQIRFSRCCKSCGILDFKQGGYYPCQLYSN